MLTYEYDSTYPGPALPIVEIGSRQVGGTDEVILSRAIVDSGADGTLIPLQALNKVKARKVDSRRMRGVQGFSQVVEIYEVALRIGVYSIPKVYAVADRHNHEIILGRDVLNHFIVTLNGLASTVEVSQ